MKKINITIIQKDLEEYSETLTGLTKEIESFIETTNVECLNSSKNTYKKLYPQWLLKNEILNEFIIKIRTALLRHKLSEGFKTYYNYDSYSEIYEEIERIKTNAENLQIRMGQCSNTLSFNSATKSSYLAIRFFWISILISFFSILISYFISLYFFKKSELNSPFFLKPPSFNIKLEEVKGNTVKQDSTLNIHNNSDSLTKKNK